MTPCPLCRGTGTDPRDLASSCGSCGGTGRKTYRRDRRREALMLALSLVRPVPSAFPSRDVPKAQPRDPNAA